MEGSGHLFEAAAGHAGEPGLLQQLQAVHHVRGLALGLGCLDRGGRKADSREGIHGTYTYIHTYNMTHTKNEAIYIMTYVQASLHGTYIYMHKYNMAHIKMTTYMTHLRTTLHTYIHTYTVMFLQYQAIYLQYLSTYLPFLGRPLLPRS